MDSVLKHSFPVPVDLESLLFGLQELKKDYDRRTVWNWLYKMSDKCGYGIHTEISATLSVNEKNSESAMRGSGPISNETGDTSETSDTDPIGERLILIQRPHHKRKMLCNKHSTMRDAKAQSMTDKKYSRLQRECNGVVIDTNTWRILALPPPQHVSSGIIGKKINYLLKKGTFDVIPIQDGTIVTLYSWEHPTEGRKWAISSSRGYDVSSFTWSGPLTYAEILDDLFSRLYPEFKEQTGMKLLRDGKKTHLSFANLDHTRSYTIGFRHHNFHPLLKDPERIWQVHSANLSCIFPTISYQIGLPVIPFQRALQNVDGGITFDELVGTSKNSVDNAKKYITSKYSADDTSPQEKFVYGWLLRTRQPTKYPNFIIRSYLLNTVRRLIYKDIPRTLKQNVSPLHRLEFITLSQYFREDTRDYKIFTALFPHLYKRVSTYQTVTDSIVNSVFDFYAKGGEKKIYSSKEYDVIKDIVNTINERNKLHRSSFSNESLMKDILKDILRDICFAPHYIMYINSQQEKKD